MQIEKQISAYIASVADAKRSDVEALHEFISNITTGSRQWFLDGKNEEGKVVSNPNIGYGSFNIKYADGKTREFYQVGLSANTSGISVYIMGIEDRKYLPATFGKTIGKATVTGYCIKFRSIKDINLVVLEDAIRFGINETKNK